jgi:hypothetical protein
MLVVACLSRVYREAFGCKSFLKYFISLSLTLSDMALPSSTTSSTNTSSSTPATFSWAKSKPRPPTINLILTPPSPSPTSKHSQTLSSSHPQTHLSTLRPAGVCASFALTTSSATALACTVSSTTTARSAQTLVLARGARRESLVSKVTSIRTISICTTLTLLVQRSKLREMELIWRIMRTTTRRLWIRSMSLGSTATEHREWMCSWERIHAREVFHSCSYSIDFMFRMSLGFQVIISTVLTKSPRFSLGVIQF